MTIKKRIALSFAFMLAVPVLLMMLTGLFFRLYYFGGDSSAAREQRGSMHRMDEARGPMPVGAFLFIAGTGLFLLTANAILSLTVSREILRPLARLEAAAQRIKEGDLSPAGGHVASGVSVTEARRGEVAPDEFGRVETAFEEMRERLHRSLAGRVAEEENRREMIASISHDLRTPIAAILGYAEGLHDGVADTREKQDRYLAIIRNKAELMTRLVDDLSLFSGFETGGVVLDRAPVDFATFLGEVLDELDFDYPGLRIERGAFEATTLSCDATQIKRVIANIVQNAARHAAPCSLLVTLSRADGALNVAFADDGPGIAAEDLPRVFERFYRGDKSRNPRTGSQGLGLSIARMIVEAHGGEIHAESPPGAGTRIVMRLPFPPDEAPRG